MAGKLGEMDALGTPFDPDRWWELLTSGSFGGAALSIHAVPMIVPVRYPQANTLHVDRPDTAPHENNEPPAQQGFTRQSPRNFGLEGREGLPDLGRVGRAEIRAAGA